MTNKIVTHHTDKLHNWHSHESTNECNSKCRGKNGTKLAGDQKGFLFLFDGIPIRKAWSIDLISLEKFGLTVQLMQTPPPRNFPRMSMDILLSATSWSYLHEVACPLQLHFSQWKPFAAVPGFHGIWLYMGQHFSHLSPHVWRSHSHSWCWETIPPLNGTLLISATG